MIYGNPSITIEDDQTDIVGMRRLVLSQMWQPSSWPLPLDQLDGQAPDAPEVPGAMGIVGKQTRRQSGALRTFWHYEGINGDGKDITFATRGNSPHYGFEPGFADVSIMQHPNIDQLLDAYDGQVMDTQVIWPRYVVGGSGGSGISSSIAFGGTGARSSGLNPGSSNNKINPMFGRDTYLSFQGGTYWYRYMVLDEAEIPQIEGQIFSASELPGRARNISGRDYLGVGAPYQRRGPVAIEVVEHYWLSGRGGWPKDLYGK